MPKDTAVTEFMTTDVLTVTPDTTVDEAIQLLAQRGISGAPVVDADGRLVGLLDDTDIILSEARLHAPTVVELFGAYLTLPGEQKRYEHELRHALGQTVDDLMHHEPPFVGVDATVEDVASVIVERDVGRVPVVDADGRVVGIVTRGDLVGALGRRA
jgi:CBS domain-containing protein